MDIVNLFFSYEYSIQKDLQDHQSQNKIWLSNQTLKIARPFNSKIDMMEVLQVQILHRSVRHAFCIYRNLKAS